MRKSFAFTGRALPSFFALAAMIAAPARAATETTLFTFTPGAGGARPSDVILDSAGNLYGTTAAGGTSSHGIVFKLDSSGSETVLHAFTGGADGSTPVVGLVGDPAGNLYGVTLGGGTSGLGVVFKIDGSGETVLHNFTGAPDGAKPEAALIRDSDGNLYGTTVLGGANNQGAVFKVDPTGHESILYSFDISGASTATPGPLVRDAKGNLYGALNPSFPFGKSSAGLIYKLEPSGSETVLYTFTGQADGSEPEGALVLDTEGNLYGATFAGGVANPFYGGGCGVVFKLDTSGAETAIYSFTGPPDGARPTGVIRDRAGNLFGTTAAGGSDLNLLGFGTVFEISAAAVETVLYSFPSSGLDGGEPGGLVRDSSDNLYGTTYYGGPARGGVAFKVEP